MTSRLFLLWLALVLAGGAALTASAQRRRDSRLAAQARSVTGDDFPVAFSTPRGARVYAAATPLPEMAAAIDNGLTQLFAVARKNGYNRQLNYSDYTIFIARADRTKNPAGEYSPDIAVGASQYAGSVYDQGGYVFAAGMVLAFQPCAFAIADHDRDWERVSNVVRFEGEHLVLFHNDRRRYQETADHSRGGGHPILQ